MIIALDYDDTYTEDPQFWRDFINKARESGHHVIVATARMASNTADIAKELPGVEVIASNGGEKYQAVREAGISDVSVWIDDMPWLIGR